VIVIMSGKSYMLPEIEGGEEREKLRCDKKESVSLSRCILK